MRSSDRLRYLMRAPGFAWELLLRGNYDFSYDFMPFHLAQIPWEKRFNLIKTGLNLFYRRLVPWSWPIYMNIELTNFCNLKCPVCPTGIGNLNRKPKAMDINLFKRVMEELGQYLVTISLWGWGESLLHPQLAKILQIASKYKAGTILSTNGQNLNDSEVLNAIINHPPTYLLVALDGITDKTNSQYRVGAKLEPALSGVKRLAEMKRERGLNIPVLHMRYIVMKHNEHEIPLLEEFAKKNSFELLTIRSLSIINDPDSAHSNLKPAAEEYRAYEYEKGKRVRKTNFVCQYAFFFPTILVDGTVVICDQDYNAQHSYGQVTEKASFEDIWFSKRASQLRKTIRHDPQKFSFCQSCPYTDRSVNTCSIQAFDLRDNH